MSNKIEKIWAECTPTETRIYTVTATEENHAGLRLSFKITKDFDKNHGIKEFLTNQANYGNCEWKEEIKQVEKELKGMKFDIVLTKEYGNL